MQKSTEKKNRRCNDRNWFIGISLNATYRHAVAVATTDEYISFTGLSHWDGRNSKEARDVSNKFIDGLYQQNMRTQNQPYLTTYAVRGRRRNGRSEEGIYRWD